MTKKLLETKEDAEIFIKAILNPPEPNKALKRAHENYQLFKQQQSAKTLSKEKERLYNDLVWGRGDVKTGGQSVNHVSPKATLEQYEMGFKVEISCYRSQLQNKELCMKLFIIALNEFIEE